MVHSLQVSCHKHQTQHQAGLWLELRLFPDYELPHSITILATAPIAIYGSVMSWVQKVLNIEKERGGRQQEGRKEGGRKERGKVRKEGELLHK